MGSGKAVKMTEKKIINPSTVAAGVTIILPSSEIYDLKKNSTVRVGDTIADEFIGTISHGYNNN